MRVLRCHSYVLILFVCLSFYSHVLRGQGLTVNVSQLNFGVVNELAGASRSLTISNSMGRTITVNDIKFYATYGEEAFSTSNSFFTIPDGGSVAIDVWFNPRHNIYHNSEMVILNDGLRGSVSVDLVGQGTYSNTYYGSSQNKSEEDLKTELSTIIRDGYVSLLYGPARDEMFMLIDNQRVNGQGASQNTLESVYTGAQAVGYTSRTDAQTNYLFNTEHTWPQSLFSSMEPMRSDIHHLFPTDDASNSIRADNPFGVVSNPSWTVGGSKSNGTIFEPKDDQKARSARALFYFVLRYENYSNFLNSQESILRNWHSSFPPDAIDIKRNNDIFSFQDNRNPFIDYPQFIDRINSLSTFSTAPVISSLDVIQDTMIYGTVSPGLMVDFRFVLVNHGNSTISLSQFQLSHSGILSFASGGNDTTLAPGESIGLDIRFLSFTTDSVRGWLTFQTSVPGQNVVSVPIFVNDLIFNSVAENTPELFRISPNPTSEFLNITFVKETSIDYDFSLYSMNGSLLKEFSISNSHELIDLSDYSAGIYFLKYRNSATGWNSYTRVVKLH
ncbi:MAG: endonuclease [Bacteroidia bacterium]|nr:endonuclease [Bacteroidia bacterium]